MNDTTLHGNRLAPTPPGHSDDTVVVVGAGLTGLFAANLLADQGRTVTVLETRGRPGGRATTDDRQGHLFNQGPHALYRSGRAAHLLHRMGLDPEGGTPPPRGQLALVGGRLGLLPTGPVTLARTRLLDPGDKLVAGWVLARLPRLSVAAFAHLSAESWVAGVTERPRVRELLRSVLRLTTYCHDLDRLSAAVALAQLQLSLEGGVLYGDGGWQRMVDQLTARARARQVSIETGTTVTSVRPDNGGLVVATSTGCRRAGAVVLAGLAPTAAARLTGAPALADLAAAAVPVTAACLDIGLRQLPSPERLFLLGLDQPVYVSVHSPPADLGSGVTLHAMRYLTDPDGGPGDGGCPDPDGALALRRDLEALVDRLQPGWREVLVTSRFQRRLRVAHAVPSPTSVPGRIADQRADVAVPEMPGVFLAGDWVGQIGHLADAAAASADDAATAVARHLERRYREPIARPAPGTRSGPARFGGGQ